MKNNIGKVKVDIAKDMALNINKNIKINAIEANLSKDNINILERDYDYIIDACDTLNTKLELIKFAKDNNIKIALLKDGSPSCGKNYIYDGTFTKTKIKGYGIFSSLLINNEIEIYAENDIEELLKRTV